MIERGIMHRSLITILTFVCAISTTQLNCYSQESPPIPLAGVDAAFSRPSSPSQPVVVPPISFVDVNSGRFGKLEIDLEDGQFLSTAVGKLHVLAKNLDVQDGTLKSLSILVQRGHLHDFIFDKLELDTNGDLKFDSTALLNHRLLQFEQPVQADVSVLVSQASLNEFLSSPKTLERLSTSANRKANALAGLASMVGIKVNQIGLVIESASLKLERHNKFKMDFSSKLGLGDVGLPLNGEIQAELALEDGSLTITNAHVITGGQEIPQELSNFLIKKINLIPALSQKSEDIRFNFTDLKVLAGKQIQLSGTATVTRLSFGNRK